MEKINIGQKIKARLEDRGMTITEFAKRLKRTSQSVYHVFNSTSIDTELLQRVSDILEYDFFSLYTTTKPGTGEAKTPRKKKISILIDIEDIDQQKAILKVAGISLK
jgi:transcriptional regulator with XRE-family HTH domain